MVRNINKSSTQSRPMTASSPSTPITRLIEQAFDDPFFAAAMTTSGRTAMLPLDVSEDGENFIVRASLAGFDRDDVDVELSEGVLTVRAEKNEEEAEGNERWLRRERRWGAVERTVVLPSAVKEERVTAEFRNGVLELKLPKVQKALARKILVTGEEPAGRKEEEPSRLSRAGLGTAGTRPTAEAAR